MGASGWSYFVPFKQDVRKAFQDLKTKVFRDKDYYDPYARYDDSLTFEDFLPKGIELTEDLKRIFRIEYENLLKAKKIVPRTIEELIRKNGETGTHSILDISEISETEDYNRSGKIRDSDLLDIFSTLKPSKDLIISKGSDLQTYRGRWLCTYVIAFQKDLPSEIYFTGFSGD